MYGVNIIFVDNLDVGMKKMEEIKREKELLGIKVENASYMYYPNPSQFYLRFDNSEVWIVSNVSKIKPRAYRWSYALIDSTLDKDMVEWIEAYCASPEDFPNMRMDFFDPEVE